MKKRLNTGFLAALILISLAIVLVLVLVRVIPETLPSTSIEEHVTSSNANSLEEQSICRDRFGEPIKRKDVMLTTANRPMRKGFMTIGISTIQRIKSGKKISYIEHCVESHLKPLSDAEKEEISIVILLGDDDVEKRLYIQRSIMKAFPAYVENGTIKLIYVPQRYYQPLENIPQTYGDPPWRVKWRSKQTLDFSFLTYFCHGLADYYLHLEDDIQSDPNYYQIIKEDLSDKKIMAEPWIMRQYWNMGFIGKLIKNDYLKALADYWNLFYYEMPLDWTYMFLLKATLIERGQVVSRRFPFKHVAKHSSSNNDDVLGNGFARKLH